MKLMTRFELMAYRNEELRCLFRKVSDELIKSKTDTFNRRNALASLENIQRELAIRGKPG